MQAPGVDPATISVPISSIRCFLSLASWLTISPTMYLSPLTYVACFGLLVEPAAVMLLDGSSLLSFLVSALMPLPLLRLLFVIVAIDSRLIETSSSKPLFWNTTVFNLTSFTAYGLVLLSFSLQDRTIATIRLLCTRGLSRQKRSAASNMSLWVIPRRNYSYTLLALVLNFSGFHS